MGRLCSNHMEYGILGDSEGPGFYFTGETKWVLTEWIWDEGAVKNFNTFKN